MAKHVLRFDPNTRILEMVFTGTWTPQDHAAWEREYRALVPKDGRPWFILNDITDFPPQTDAITKGMESAIGFALRNGMRTCVAVAPAAVIELQARRVTSSSGTNDVFLFRKTREEAMAILRQARAAALGAPQELARGRGRTGGRWATGVAVRP